MKMLLGREFARAAGHDIGDESAELVIRHLGPAGRKHRNWARIVDARHRRDRTMQRQLNDIRPQVNGQRRGMQQRVELRVILDPGAKRIDHRQQRKAGALAGIGHGRHALELPIFRE